MHPSGTSETRVCAIFHAVCHIVQFLQTLWLMTMTRPMPMKRRKFSVDFL